jgi:hypothetical protein
VDLLIVHPVFICKSQAATSCSQSTSLSESVDLPFENCDIPEQSFEVSMLWHTALTYGDLTRAVLATAAIGDNIVHKSHMGMCGRKIVVMYCTPSLVGGLV